MTRTTVTCANVTDTAQSSGPPPTDMTGPPLRLVTDAPVRPTPPGALHALTAPRTDPEARLLRRLLADAETPRLSLDAVRAWTGLDGQAALQQLRLLQDAAWIEAIDTPRAVPTGSPDQLLGPLLATLSSTERAVLTEVGGTAWAAPAMLPDEARALADLCVEWADLHGRLATTLEAASGYPANGWAIVDGHGLSRLGCWQLHVGSSRFVLAVEGLPRLMHEHVTTLAWVLVRNFA